jgi:uncharacterized protein (TIGR00255 family)
MVLSMTGYGQSKRENGEKVYRFEIKSLNGKTTDIRFRSSTPLMNKELELRRIILDKGVRGKFDANLVIENMGTGDDQFLNKGLMRSYYKELSQLSEELGFDKGDILQSIIRLPNILQNTDRQLNEDEWHIIKSMAIEAVDQLNKFREEEGISLYNDTTMRVKKIQHLLTTVVPFEADRITSLKDRIQKNLKQHMSKENVDKNRFEQEILFYLEKLDINEEKTRLNQHCIYFLQEIDDDSATLKGKKLSFISQEMGREINTLGAKAQHSEIQQVVVQMKDELEKIKEQLLNIL